MKTFSRKLSQDPQRGLVVGRTNSNIRHLKTVLFCSGATKPFPDRVIDQPFRASSLAEFFFASFCVSSRLKEASLANPFRLLK